MVPAVMGGLGLECKAPTDVLLVLGMDVIDFAEINAESQVAGGKAMRRQGLGLPYDCPGRFLGIFFARPVVGEGNDAKWISPG